MIHCHFSQFASARGLRMIMPESECLWASDDTLSRSSGFNIEEGDRCLIFTGLTLTFLKQLAIGLWLTFPLLISLAAVITLLGQIAGKREGWSRLDSFYWSFITATTVGYGDIRPATRGSRVLALLIAFLGLILSGIIIAVAVHATNLALEVVRR
jgi:voltage-gated potassium channel